MNSCVCLELSSKLKVAVMFIGFPAGSCWGGLIRGSGIWMWFGHVWSLSVSIAWWLLCALLLCNDTTSSREVCSSLLWWYLVSGKQITARGKIHERKHLIFLTITVVLYFYRNVSVSVVFALWASYEMLPFSRPAGLRPLPQCQPLGEEVVASVLQSVLVGWGCATAILQPFASVIPPCGQISHRWYLFWRWKLWVV